MVVGSGGGATTGGSSVFDDIEHSTLTMRHKALQCHAVNRLMQGQEDDSTIKCNAFTTHSK